MEKAKETKSVSFRLPIEVYETLQRMGQQMNLSAHEVAGKYIQEKYQESPVAVDALVVNETVTASKQVFVTQLSKRISHFTHKELEKVFFAICGGSIPTYIRSMEIGICDGRGFKRIGEDLWEIEVEPLNAVFK